MEKRTFKEGLACVAAAIVFGPIGPLAIWAAKEIKKKKEVNGSGALSKSEL